MSHERPKPLELFVVGKNGLVSELSELSPEAAELVAGTLALYRAVGYVPPWVGFLAVTRGEVVGSCAFKGPPRKGMVEIAFVTLPRCEGKGFATAMAKELVGIAQASRNPPRIGAQTPGVEGAATSVLRKAGFVRTSVFHHPHAGKQWNWEATKKPSKTG